MHWSLVLGCICALGVAAQNADLPPELATLARVKQRTNETLARQPNYTCIQQVERSYRRLPKRKFELHDLLRIEVAIVEGKEMYAWPGSRKFEETDLTEMVSGGAIGTGNFATHASAVFRTSAPQFKFEGPAEINGRNAIKFNYVVPLFNSGYRIRVGQREAIVGYHGSFWADAKTNELIRLEVVADDIPPFLGIAAAQDSMEYARRKIGASEFLLPAGSELVMTDLQGNESRNRTLFTGCRQYSGESVLTFAEAPSDSESAKTDNADAREKESIVIPEDLEFNVKFENGFDVATAAVGDPAPAILDEDIRVKRRVLLAKGARLSGRIARLDRENGNTVLDFQFYEADSPTTHATLNAVVEPNASAFTGRFAFQSSMYERQRRAVRPGGMLLRGDGRRFRPGERIRVKTVNPTSRPAGSHTSLD